MKGNRFLLLHIFLLLGAGTIPLSGSGQTFNNNLQGVAVLKCKLKSVPETSGLVFTDGKLWTHGDGGNSPNIYAIDTVTGNVIQTVRIDNYKNTDWEDIAADKDFIYIGDFGNNLGNRTDLKILKIAKDSIGEQDTVHVKAQAIQFSYLDQQSYAADSKTDYNCEALISFHDSMYLFTKDHRDYKTRVYSLPKIPGKYEVSPMAESNIGLVTGADCDTLSNKIVLVGYDGSKRHSFLYLLSKFQGNRFFSGKVEKVMSADNTQWQTEGVCFANSQKLFISCETTSDVSASLYNFGLQKSQATFTPIPTTENASCFPNPAADELNIYSKEKIKSLSIRDFQGKIIVSMKENKVQIRLNLNEFNLRDGVYFLEWNAGKTTEVKKLVIQH